MSFDRIAKKTLIEALHETGYWDAWRGPNNTRPVPPAHKGLAGTLVAQVRDTRPDPLADTPPPGQINLFWAIAARILNKRGPSLSRKRHIDTSAQNHSLSETLIPTHALPQGSFEYAQRLILAFLRICSDKRNVIDAFLRGIGSPSDRRARARARGGLLFALDATASRQPTWDSACRLQADMFREAAAIGGLDVQLAFYRGRDEFRPSQWVSQPERLAETDGPDRGAAAARRRSARCSPIPSGGRRSEEGQDSRAGLHRRRDGGEARRSVPYRRRTWDASFYVPRGR